MNVVKRDNITLLMTNFCISHTLITTRTNAIDHSPNAARIIITLILHTDSRHLGSWVLSSGCRSFDSFDALVRVSFSFMLASLNIWFPIGETVKCKCKFLSTGISSQIRTKLRDWAVWQAKAGCYSQAALSSNDSKTLYL